jgi:hypothetical protein
VGIHKLQLFGSFCQTQEYLRASYVIAAIFTLFYLLGFRFVMIVLLHTYRRGEKKIRIQACPWTLPGNLLLQCREPKAAEKNFETIKDAGCRILLSGTAAPPIQ